MHHAFMSTGRSEFMRGKITSGFGQAQYFLSREGYCRHFWRQLGYIPFPGTLNVLLEVPFPAKAKAIMIEGFSEENRSFGECKCYRIKINGIDAAAIRPERSRYPPELIEVIAPVHLRRALGLVDGDDVEIILL
jgi:riboflavin kinase